MIGQDVKPNPESNNTYSAPSKLATMRVRWAGTIMLMRLRSAETPDCQRDSGSTQGPSAASGWNQLLSVHSQHARKAASRLSPWAS